MDWLRVIAAHCQIYSELRITDLLSRGLVIGVIITFGTITTLHAELDTLGNCHHSRYVHYNDPAITMQAARFELAQPGYLRQIVIALSGGNAHGSATVHIFGSEGGANAPFVERDLIRPVTISKKKSGIEYIELTLEEVPHLRTRQFFIAVDNLSPGVTLLSDRVRLGPACRSPFGGYHYQFLKNNRGQWLSGEFSYAIDAIVEYDDEVSKEYLVDVTQDIGVADSLLETSSIAWGDYDRNGTIDLLLDTRLLRNRGDGRFEDITNAVGITGAGRAGVFIDIDNDGDADILHLGSRDESGESRLFVNDNGMFEAHVLSLPNGLRPSSVVVSDFDGDGYLDLFVGQTCGEEIRSSYLFVNTRSLDMVDRSEFLGDSALCIGSRGVQSLDFNGDGYSDLFAVGDDPNSILFLKNESGTGFSTVRIAEGVGRSFTEGYVGGDWTDYNHDGHLDLLLSQSVPATAVSGPIPLIYSGFNPVGAEQLERSVVSVPDVEGLVGSSSWGDADNDGLADLVVTAGCECLHTDIVVQHPDGSFAVASSTYGFWNVRAGPDALWVDYDNDGRLDVCTTADGRFTLYHNQRPYDGNYIEIDPVGPVAVGSDVTVYAGELKYTQHLSSGRGLLMQGPNRLHFGLGAQQTVDSVTIRWTNGAVETHHHLAVNTIHRLVAGAQTIASKASAVDLQIYPNPFKDELTLKYVLPERVVVQCELFSLTGVRVAVLVHDMQSAGTHSITWHAVDDSKTPLPQGTYLYRFTADGQVRMGQIVLSR